MRALPLFAAGAAGHGAILDPPPRAAHLIKGDVAGSTGSCALGICFWFSQSCTIGCPKCLGSDSSDGKCDASQQGKATLPDRARTYWYPTGLEKQPVKDCGVNPWCAPGSAPIMDPCGVAGGDIVPGKPGNGGNPPAGAQQGDRGSLLPPLNGTKATTWKVGSVVDISWFVIANHGGGYQYRLCPKDNAGGLTEECFQQTPMPFSGDEQYIQYCTNSPTYPPYPGFLPAIPGLAPGSADTVFPPCDKDNRTAIPAVDVNTGTIPKGSTWRMNPIPGCKAIAGGAFNQKCGADGGSSPGDYQFPPAGPDLNRPGFLLGGFGAGSCYGIPDGCGFSKKKIVDHTFKFNVVDKVVVPKVPPGEYVMSFRWDCEQTPQIWATCADVTIAE